MSRVARVFLVSLILGASIILTAAQPVTSVRMTQPPKDQVVRLAGIDLGVWASRRAVLGERGPTDIKSIRLAATGDPISERERGVVFNYGMGAYGLISGEIAFEVLPGFDPRSLSWVATPPPKLLVPPSVYVVNAPTGSEFLRIMSMLETSKSVRWAEPAVSYIPFVIE